MSSPLIVLNGQIHQAGLTKLDLPNINIGVPPTVIVTGPTVTKTLSTINLVKIGGGIDVTDINGAEEGDLLVVYGDNVKLKRSGNMSAMPSDMTLEPGRCIVLHYWGGGWKQVSRSQ